MRVLKGVQSDDLQHRVEEYATWVQKLRAGKSVEHLHPDEGDPLSALGNELEQLAHALSVREQEVRQLFDLVERIEKGLSVEDVLNRVFVGFSGLIPFNRIGCAFIASGGNRVTAYWARSELGPPQITQGYSQPLPGSSLERILLTREPRILSDLQSYLEEKPQSDSTRRIVKEGGRSSLTCPLIVDHRAIGFLFFTSREKNAYNEVHQAIFRRIANQVSVVIDKSRAFERFIQQNRQLLQQNKELEVSANFDPLTKVLNRGAILRMAEQTLKDASQSHSRVGVIMVDIDHFKQINDTLGHAAGDHALSEVAARLTRALRPSDRIGRYGGEEFLVIVIDTTRDGAFEVANRLCREIADAHMELGGTTRSVTASFGVAVSATGNESLAELIASADEALYQAKDSGRNKVVAAWNNPKD